MFRDSERSSRAETASIDTAVLEEILDVLRSVARIRAPDRALAVRYTAARANLLASRLGEQVPPYLQQCVSVVKFHDFINLFAPHVTRRL